MWKNQTWQIMLGDLRSTGLTFQAIGKEINVGRSFVYRMLSGESRPSITTYEAIQELHKKNSRAIGRAKRLLGDNQ